MLKLEKAAIWHIKPNYLLCPQRQSFHDVASMLIFTLNLPNVTRFGFQNSADPDEMALEIPVSSCSTLFHIFFKILYNANGACSHTHTHICFAALKQCQICDADSKIFNYVLLVPLPDPTHKYLSTRPNHSTDSMQGET